MSLMGGSVCATGSNPLAQLVKRQGVDRSLQHEPQKQAMAGPTSSFRSQQRADLQQFKNLDQGTAFSFDDLQAELPNAGPRMLQGAPQTQQARFVSGPTQQAPWTAEFHASSGAQWANQFKVDSPGAPISAAPVQNMTVSRAPIASVSADVGFMPFRPFSHMGMNSMPIAPLQQHQQPQQLAARDIVQLDDRQWEEQFKNFESSTKAEGSKSVEDGKVRVEDVLQEQEISQEALDNLPLDEFIIDESYPDNWEETWNSIKNELKDDISSGRMHTADYTGASYEFSEDNPYLQEPDPYALGVELMDRGAKLNLAVQCFEAALQRDRNHVAAWNRLGAALAQNEMEEQAMRAFKECLQLDPKNEQALMNLAVSYTNEGYENSACEVLKKWITVKYPDIAAQEKSLMLQDSDPHSVITKLFMRAAQLAPSGSNMDADVQVGLGVLFYRNEDFAKAADCFRAALQVRPRDPLLWNRLGATLANSSRSEEAIEAYYKALELRPSFVRARCNLGVSCINMGCYKEAAEHLLSAMFLHQGDQGGPHMEHSYNLSNTLRRVFLAMDRRDLESKVRQGMNLNEFRSEFNF